MVLLKFSARIKGIFTSLCLLMILTCSSAVYSQDTLLVLGDSLSSAHGIPIESGWVALLQQKLNMNKRPYKVVNASISGMTSEEGASQIQSLLTRVHPKLLILALGSNDGLRGLSLNAMTQNLSFIIKEAEQQSIKVLLIPFLIPSNYGLPYRKAFENVFKTLARQYDLVEVPFLLKNVALNPALMQSDGLHPNEAAQAIILENVWPYLIKVLNNK